MAIDGRTCRWRSRGPVCGRPAILELLRGNRRPTWYGYCAEHSYGRVLLQDGIYYAYEVGQHHLVAIVGGEGEGAGGA